MLQNLKIEWMKIKNYRVFQVFSILYVLGIIAIIFIFYKVYITLMGEMSSAMSGGAVRSDSDIFALFSSDTIWQTVCWSTSILLYLPGMIIIMLFTNEVNFKTHRQNIIDGWKRETFIYSKILLIICISLVVALVNILAVFIMCQVTKVAFTFNFLMFFNCFLISFAYLLFALTLAILFRKSGIAIILFFVYSFLVESLLMGLLNWKSSPIGYFLPLQSADSLIPFPKNPFKGLPEYYIMLIATAIYCSIYLFFAVRKYKKDDL